MWGFVAWCGAESAVVVDAPKGYIKPKWKHSPDRIFVWIVFVVVVFFLLDLCFNPILVHKYIFEHLQ